MYCPQCGTHNDDNNFRCVQCGNILQAAPTAPGFGDPYAAGYDVPQTTSGMAIAGFILAFLCGLIGLILSILAFNQIKKNPALKGEGLAIAGIIIAALNMMAGCLLQFSGAF